jgi:hypothetical protein
VVIVSLDFSFLQALMHRHLYCWTVDIVTHVTGLQVKGQSLFLHCNARAEPVLTLQCKGRACSYTAVQGAEPVLTLPFVCYFTIL